MIEIESINVRIYQRNLNEFVTSKTGPTGKYLRKWGQNVKRKAKVTAGKDTHALVRSLYVNHRRGRPLVGEVVVGSNVPHAYVHHEGAKPHEMVVKRGKGMRFVYNGRVVYVQTVQHPGNRPNRYLSSHLRSSVP